MTKTARVSLGGIPSAMTSLSTSSGEMSLEDKETSESFKIYPFAGEDYVWEEWSVKFLVIASSKGVEDFLMPDPDGFYKVPTNSQWKQHKDAKINLSSARKWCQPGKQISRLSTFSHLEQMKSLSIWFKG